MLKVNRRNDKNTRKGLEMKELLNKIKAEIHELEKAKEKIEEALKRKPEGKLRISKCRTTVQYYHKKNGGQPNGKYLRKNQQKLISQLAQKEYEEKIYKLLCEKISMLKKFMIEYPKLDAVSVYEQIPIEKQKWVTPYEVSDEEYQKQWSNVEYNGKTFSDNVPQIYTEKGERVRSKSEKIIADKLYAMNIPYRYEYPITLKGYGVVYPDFCVLNVRTRKEYYLEHLGMMDSQGYVEKAILKINTYALNQIHQGRKLVFTYETKMQPLDSRVLEGLFKEYFL